jgi:hypothetical protein
MTNHSSTSSALSPEARKYIQRVEELFEWIKKQTSEIAQVTDSQPTKISEGGAEYEAPVLIAIPRHSKREVRFFPRGYSWGGTEGRVDVESDLGRERLLFLGEKDGEAEVLLLEPRYPSLERKNSIQNDVLEGWVLQQSPRPGLNPSLTADLLHRLLEVMSR